MDRVELGLAGVGSVPPQSHGLRALFLDGGDLVEGEVLLPVVRRRLAVAEGGRDATNVLRRVRLQELADVGMHLEAEEAEHSLTL